MLWSLFLAFCTLCKIPLGAMLLGFFIWFVINDEIRKISDECEEKDHQDKEINSGSPAEPTSNAAPQASSSATESSEAESVGARTPYPEDLMEKFLYDCMNNWVVTGRIKYTSVFDYLAYVESEIKRIQEEKAAAEERIRMEDIKFAEERENRKKKKKNRKKKNRAENIAEEREMPAAVQDQTPVQVQAFHPGYEVQPAKDAARSEAEEEWVDIDLQSEKNEPLQVEIQPAVHLERQVQPEENAWVEMDPHSSNEEPPRRRRRGFKKQVKKVFCCGWKKDR